VALDAVGPLLPSRDLEVSGRRSLGRPLGQRRYRRAMLVVAEGTATEPQYFATFNSLQTTVHVRCVGANSSAPQGVLRTMRRLLKEIDRRDDDEAWLVVDKDSWPDSALDELFSWSTRDPSCFLAVSNPKFEYWLLLHFEAGDQAKTAQDCARRLKAHLPNYHKRIDPASFSPERIRQAVERARRRDSPPCADWPRQPGQTTVYRLVEHIDAGENGPARR